MCSHFIYQIIYFLHVHTLKHTADTATKTFFIFMFHHILRDIKLIHHIFTFTFFNTKYGNGLFIDCHPTNKIPTAVHW